MTTLGTLSIHLDGGPCRVGCRWCYLGARTEEGPRRSDRERRFLPVVEEALGTLRYEEVAVAVSEPVAEALAPLRRIVAAARGRAPVTVTTTPQIAGAAAAELFEGVARVNLSIDSVKGVVAAPDVRQVAESVKERWPAVELVLVATLDSPAFAARLIEGGLLEELVGLAAVDKVALNALKPPPPWCDRRWWMAALATLRASGLLERELERRLFLDCYVAARIVGLGGCPGRADLSPAAGGAAFRSCVYQPAPEAVVAGAAPLAAHVGDRWTAPAACPFEIL